jgi:hypothetical protein
MLRCPVCKAENAAGPTCRRCKADLTMLFALEAQRERALAEARAGVAAGRWQEAQESAAEADGLRRDAESLKLVALTALLCGDYHQAWRSYAIWKEADEAVAHG